MDLGSEEGLARAIAILEQSHVGSEAIEKLRAALSARLRGMTPRLVGLTNFGNT